MNYKVCIRFVQNDEYIGTEPYHVEIADDTKEDELMSALMDSTREILNEENQDNEVWQNGDVVWTLIDFEKF